MKYIYKFNVIKSYL